MRHAEYQVLKVVGHIVYIKDMGGNMSITNDAEHVVRTIVKDFGSLITLFYVDSLGYVDELLIKNGEFDGFNILSDVARHYHAATLGI